MDALLLMVVPFAGYIVAYYTYGRFLARKIFKLNPSAKVPARELEDGIDYVPTRKGIIFGHHYTSIAGTGPIVGPAIGIIWGWVPAIIWIFVGSIIMGAMHDFGSLVVSMRNQGRSLSEVSAKYISPRVRTIFFLIVFFELLIVIAIFALVIALLFGLYPHAVFPIWMQIPIAVFLGFIVYKKHGNVTLFTALAVITMYLTVILGHYLPGISLDSWAAKFGMPVTGFWAIILLVYAYIASTLRVTTLLQPRDYINAWQLFVAMGLMMLGVFASTFAGKLHLVAPIVSLQPEGAPPLWPFLCVTIACGAISGFHSLVSSGTTPKQISNEQDAQFVGYGSMLMEAALATLALIAVAAGIAISYKTKTGAILTGSAAWQAHYASWGAAAGLGSKVKAVVEGAANMMACLGIPYVIAVVIMGVFVASFAGTTLDSATRIQRYCLSEIASGLKLKALTNRWTATAFAVVSAGILVFATGASGKGALTLWPLFGAANQLLAGLALLVVTLYLKRKAGKGYLVAALPCLFMLVMTVWAVVLNQKNFITQGNWLLASINAALLLLALWMIAEAVPVFVRPKTGNQSASRS